MKKCPDCAEEIQDEAVVCKHCQRDLRLKSRPGLPTPPRQRTSPAVGCLAIILVLGALMFIGTVLSIPSSPSSTSDTPAPGEVPCRESITCWAGKHMASAAGPCKRVVERLATNNFEWADGAFEQKFSNYRWKDEDTGAVTYIGDKIKFQNGFGAWIYHTYECDVDVDATGTTTVRDARARPGRLN